MKKKSIKPYLMIISSMLIFGTIGIFRRYIPVASSVLALERGIVGALCISIFVKITKGKVFSKIGKKNLLLLMLTGVLIGLNWVFLFESYNYTTVSIATLCYYMEPTIVIFLSPLLFKEKLGIKKIVCALVSFLGMFFVSGMMNNETLSIVDGKGIAFGLTAALLYAIVVMLNKKIHVDNAYEKTVIQLFSAALIMVPYVLVTEDISRIELSSVSIVMMLVVGIVHTGFAYALYFGSMKYLKAQSIAVLSYIDPVSALILSAVFLNEKLSLSGFIGAVLIIGSALICEINFKGDSNK